MRSEMRPEQVVSDVYVRTLLPTDLEDVGKIAGDTDGWTADKVQRAIESREKVFFGLVGIVNGEIIGYLIYQCKKSHIRLRWIGVASEHQGYGVARSLLTHLAERFSADQFVAVVDEYDVDEQVFLRSIGFEHKQTDQGPPDRYLLEYKRSNS